LGNPIVGPSGNRRAVSHTDETSWPPRPPYIYFRSCASCACRSLRWNPSARSLRAIRVMERQTAPGDQFGGAGLSIEWPTPPMPSSTRAWKPPGAGIAGASCSFYEQVEAPLFRLGTSEPFDSYGSRLRADFQIREAAAAVVDEAFTGGLLQTWASWCLPPMSPSNIARRATSRSQHLAECETERQVIGATHAEVGGCLLANWGLPWPIVEAVALHHAPVATGKPGFLHWRRSMSPMLGAHGLRGHQSAGD